MVHYWAAVNKLKYVKRPAAAERFKARGEAQSEAETADAVAETAGQDAAPPEPAADGSPEAMDLQGELEFWPPEEMEQASGPAEPATPVSVPEDGGSERTDEADAAAEKTSGSGETPAAGVERQRGGGPATGSASQTDDTEPQAAQDWG